MSPFIPILTPPSLDMNQPHPMFSRVMSPESIAEVQAAVHRDTSFQNKNLRAIPPDPMTSAKWSSSFASMSVVNEDDFRASFTANMVQNAQPGFSPLERLPCANIEVEKYKTCPNPGARACSACKLVSYCSKVCVAHCNPFLIASEPRCGIVGLPE